MPGDGIQDQLAVLLSRLEGIFQQPQHVPALAVS
jgi:hypothetical protein